MRNDGVKGGRREEEETEEEEEEEEEGKAPKIRPISPPKGLQGPLKIPRGPLQGPPNSQERLGNLGSNMGPSGQISRPPGAIIVMGWPNAARWRCFGVCRVWPSCPPPSAYAYTIHGACRKCVVEVPPP
eukprot:1998341-Pyramimonas_sp.AAC.2